MSYMLAGWDLEELFLRSAPNFFVSELESYNLNIKFCQDEN